MFIHIYTCIDRSNIRTIFGYKTTIQMTTITGLKNNIKVTSSLCTLIIKEVP